MEANTPSEWLTIDINDLPLTGQFKKIASELSFVTIGDIVKKDVSELLGLAGFNYHILQELVQFLEAKELTGVLRQ